MDSQRPYRENNFHAAVPSDDEIELFCQAYVAKGFNGAAAMRDIKTHLTDASARSYAYRWLTMPVVKARILEICEEKKKQYSLDSGSIISELMHIAFADMSEFQDSEGDLDAEKLKNAPPHVRRAVEALETSTTFDKDGGKTRKVKIKMSNKLRALELLGKNPALRLFVEQLEHAGEGGGPINFTLNFVKPDKENKNG